VFLYLKKIPVSLLFIVDLLLFPMFHIGALSLKISFILLTFWALQNLLLKKRINKNFLNVLTAFTIIIFCGLIGDFYIELFIPNMIHVETAWSILIYVLIILSFGYSNSVNTFNFKWLYYIFFSSIILNFIFIFGSNYMPAIANFYYSDAEKLGVSDVDQFVNMLRPVGIFGNPNTSMLQVNIIYLFIVVCIRKNILKINNSYFIYLLTFSPVLLSFVLGSRSEMIVSIILGTFIFVNYYKKYVILYLLKSLIFILLIFYFAITIIEKSTNLSSTDTIEYAIKRFTGTFDTFLDKNADESQGIDRPLLLLQTVKSRFVYSPLFGTGYNHEKSETFFPFDDSPRYYHNDWFRLLITGGLISVLIILMLIYNIVKKIDFLLVIPFILPGLTNTFILTIPSVMFYSFMIGILINVNKIYYKNEEQNIFILKRL
jgi:O-antigen ligase